MIKPDDQKFVKTSTNTVQCSAIHSAVYNTMIHFHTGYHTLCSLSIMKHLLKHKFTVIHLDTLNVTVVSEDEEANQDWKKK